MNDVYCPLPWTSMTIQPNNNVCVCCISRPIGSTKENTLSEMWNSDNVKKLRTDMISGVRNSLCNTCYKHEDLGMQSARQSWVKAKPEIEKIVAETKPDGTLDRFELTMLDVGYSNLCNFKCRICDPSYSSKIAVEISSDTALITNHEGVLDQIREHYPHLNLLKFMGGEPLMQPEHWVILDELVKLGYSKNIDLIYNTNGSVLSFKNKSILDYWQHFSGVNAQISIDAMGKQAEYWRDGTVWAEMEDNIRQYKTCDNVNLSFHGTVGWPNVFSWISFVKYAIENKFVGANKFSAWLLTNPIEFSLQSAPSFKKDEIRIEIEKLIDYLTSVESSENFIERLTLMIKFMYNADTSKVVSSILRIKLMNKDKIRGKKFLEYFPEHENMRKFVE